MSNNHGLADELRSRILTPEEKANSQARDRKYTLEYGVHSIMNSIKHETMNCASKNKRTLTYKYCFTSYYKFRNDWKPVGGENAYYTALRELIIQRLINEGFHNVRVAKHISLIEGMWLSIKISW